LKQCARCRSAIPECIDGQHTGADRFGHPPAPGGIETLATNRAAEHLPLAAV
jgi:hypothetical protein